MGLAASQARLLTITGRKSDCEFQSMRYSHQKIAMARDLTDVSNEYQNSLNQTKLIYDYYGKNDKSTQLSYGILMQPSALNDYLPKLITDATGRVILDGNLAAAARAAGIPQEGLGCLPSQEMRNKFVAGLVGSGVLTYEQGATIAETQYNQAAGMGSTDFMKMQTETVTYDQLLDKLKKMDNTTFDFNNDPNLKNIKEDSGFDGLNIVDLNTNSDIGSMDLYGKDGKLVSENPKNTTKLNLADILTGNVSLRLGTRKKKKQGTHGSRDNLGEYLANTGYWDMMMKTFSDLLGLDGEKEAAINHAMNELKDKFFINNLASDDTDNGKPKSYKEALMSHDWMCQNSAQGSKINVVNDAANNNLGLVEVETKGKNNSSYVSINLSTMTKAFLTYFKEIDDGYDNSDYSVGKTPGTSEFVNNQTTFEIKKDMTTDQGTMQLSVFYDTLFNQLCNKGWSENEKINDKEYLQNMLQSGILYVTNIKDDGYYYQGNYSTDTYIKEIVDETLIAQAEAKYNTEKNKLNQKEQTIDLKMKNLDTEISSLSTEYDTVKSVISKNIEKVFKRYSA